MDDLKFAANLYQLRNEIGQKNRPLKLEFYQKNFLIKTLKHYKSKLIIAAIIITSLISLEIAIASFSRNNKLVFYILENPLFLIILVGFYLFLSYNKIVLQKKIVLFFSNDLRKKWVKIYLKLSLPLSSGQYSTQLITKLTYHFSLLQLGLSNAFWGAFSWIIYNIVAILVGIFFFREKIYLVALFIILEIFIFFLGYKISFKLLSREQTLYSKIIIFLGNVISEIDNIKLRSKELSVIKKIERMLDLDVYFRLRREIGTKFGDSIIYVLIFCVSLIIYMISADQINLNKNIFSLDNFQYWIIGLIITKQLYSSLRVGIFTYPLKLALCLCVPKKKYIFDFKKNDIKINKQISFHSKRTRLGLDASVSKNIAFNFNKGSRNLIYGAGGSGKSFLSHLFCGFISKRFNNSWIVKINNRRLFYKEWTNYDCNCQIIDPNYKTTNTVIETLSENNFAQDLMAEEISNMGELLSQYPELRSIFKNPKNLGAKINLKLFSITEMGLLQMANALLHKPQVLCIDNLWLDIRDERIIKMIQLIEKNLVDTTIICFSQNDSNIIKFNQKIKL